MPHIEADPMLPQPWVVRRVAKDTPDTFTLDLDPVVVASDRLAERLGSLFGTDR
jgi:hypothetical protein